MEPTTTECGAEDNTGISEASAGAKSTSKAKVQLQPGPEPEPNPPPPLTTKQFQVYNRLAETMEYFVGRRAIICKQTHPGTERLTEYRK